MFWNDLQLCPDWDSSGKMCMIVGAQFEIEAPGYEEVRRETCLLEIETEL